MKKKKSCVAAFLPVQWNPLKGFHFYSSPWDHRTFKQSHALKEEHNYNSDILYSKCKQIAVCLSALLCLPKGK